MDELSRIKTDKIPCTGVVEHDDALHVFESPDDMVAFMKKHQNFKRAMWVDYVLLHRKGE